MSAERTSFWSQFRRRIIVVSTMERDIRIAFAVAAAVIAVAIAIDGFHTNLGPKVRTLAGEIPILTLAALVLGELSVFSLLFTGLLRHKASWCYAVIAANCAALFATLAVNDALAEGWAFFIPPVVLWILAALRERRQWSMGRIVQGAVGAALLAMTISAIYAAAGKQALVISLLGFQAIIAMLGLFMASVDIAEIISVGMEAAIDPINKNLRSKWAALLLALLLIIATVVAGARVNGGSVQAISQSLGAGLGNALWLGLIVWLLVGSAKRLGAVTPHITYRYLLLVVGIYFLAFMGGILIRVLHDPATYDPGMVFSYTEPMAATFLVFLAFIVAFAGFGRRSPHLFMTFGYGASIGMFTFQHFSSHGENLALIPFTAASGSLLFLIVSGSLKSMRTRLKEISMDIAELNLCIIIYTIVASLFFATKNLSAKFSVWQALVVLLALAWDTISSGEAITNRHSESFPRVARICIFLSYIVSVAILVTVSATSDLINVVNARKIEGVFDSEPLVAVGLMLFGPPFFFFIFALRIRALWTGVAGVSVATLEPARVSGPPEFLRLSIARYWIIGLVALALVLGLVLWTKHRHRAIDKTDAQLCIEIMHKLNETSGRQGEPLNVRCANGAVTLIGTVDSATQRLALIREVLSVEGVKGVTDNLQIAETRLPLPSIKPESKSLENGRPFGFTAKAASIEKFWEEHNISLDGQQGMMIHVDFATFDLQSNDLQAAAFFYFDDDNQQPVNAAIEGFAAQGGQVIVVADVDYSRVIQPTVRMFLPYRALSLSPGRWNLKYHVEIRKKEPPWTVYATSEWRTFWVTGPSYPKPPSTGRDGGCCCEPGESALDCFRKCNALVPPCK